MEHRSVGLRGVWIAVMTALVVAGAAPALAVGDPVTALPTVQAPVPESMTVGLVDPNKGMWHLRYADGTTGSFFFGNPGDFPLLGDWDCDGVATPGMYRQSDGFVYLRNANSQGIADIRFFFGNPGDVPLAGDFNGNGCDTVSIYRPGEGRFYIINKLGENEGGLGPADVNYLFGNVGDKAFVGDFDGDEIDTVGLHRESTGLVYFRNSHTEGTADNQFIFGDPGDRLVAGDWNGDGTDSPALFRPSQATFYFRYTNTTGVADDSFPYGEATFLPVAGNLRFGERRATASIPGAPAELVDAIERLYVHTSNAPNIAPGLAAHLADVTRAPGVIDIVGQATLGVVRGVEVAVVTANADVVLAVKGATGWEIVGAKLARFGSAAWYGGSARHVLVVGSDARVGEDPGRALADSVHILAVAPTAGAGAIVGIPRDTFFWGSYGIDRLSHFMWDRQAVIRQSGVPPEQPEVWGIDLVVDAITSSTGVSFEGYITTGFAGFTDLVDAFRALASGQFLAWLPWPGTLGQPPASPPLQDLDGADALRFGRERKSLPRGDVDRSLGHGFLIKAALGKVHSLGIHAVPGLLAILTDMATTDLTAAELLTLGASAFELQQETVPDGPLRNEVLVSCFAHPDGQPANIGWALEDGNGNLFPEIAGALNDLQDGMLDGPITPVAGCYPDGPLVVLPIHK